MPANLAALSEVYVKYNSCYCSFKGKSVPHFIVLGRSLSFEGLNFIIFFLVSFYITKDTALHINVIYANFEFYKKTKELCKIKVPILHP